MSVFHDKFEAECKHSEDIGAYHITVNGDPLVHKDKGELEKIYERALVAGIRGWVLYGMGEDTRLKAIPVNEESPDGREIFISFVKAKVALATFLKDRAAAYRKAAIAVRSAKKLDTLAGSL